MAIGIVIVDHGSRNRESNELLELVVHQFASRFEREFRIVEAAHMEIAEPSIAQAYGRCADRGADTIVICPFFLGPGKHWTSDIPRLADEAARHWPGTQFRLAAPLGVDDLILDLLAKRTRQCLVADESLAEGVLSL